MGKNGEERCEKMKIAYLILCHTDPKHIRRLVEKVTKGTENEAFVHIDKKADSPAFREALEGLPLFMFCEITERSGGVAFPLWMQQYV